MVTSPGGGGTGSRGTTPHNEVNQEAASAHSGKGGMPPHLRNLRSGRADSGVVL